MNMYPETYIPVVYSAVYTPSANEAADLTVFVSDKRKPLLGCPDNDSTEQDNICIMA